MKVIKKSIFIFLLIITAQYSYADSAWTGVVDIIEIYQINEELVGFKLKDFENPAECLLPNEIDIGLNPETQQQSLYYLNLAFAKRYKVNLWIRNKCISTHWKDTTLADVGHVRVIP